MKKIKRSLLFLAVILALAACGQEDGSTAPVLPESSQAGSDSPDSVPAPQPDGSLQPDGGLQSPSPGIVVEDDSLPPREGMVRSRLTNEWVDPGVADTRPIAVMIPNESNAIPHYNLSKASVVYEANVEGRMSRMMAVYEG